MKLRYYLLLVFFVLVMGPIALMRFWPQSDAMDMEVAEVRGRHLLLAETLAGALERYYRDVTTMFEVLVAQNETWIGGGQASEMLGNLSIRHLCLADRGTGRVLRETSPASAPCPEEVPGHLLSYFERHGAEGQVTFGPVRTLPSGQNVIHMAKLMGDRIAIGAIRTDYFHELGRRISFGVRGHAAIVDHTGNVLSHPLDDWVADRRNIAGVPAVERMLAGDKGVTTFWSPALKGEMIAGYAPVRGPGWGVMVPQPLDELQAKAATIRRSTLAALGAGAVIAISLAMLFSVMLARPVERMSAFSRAVATGDAALISSIRPSRLLPLELTELQTNFRDMVVRLRGNMRRINEMAFGDTVTDLANREWFRRRLTAMIESDCCPGEEGVLIFFDLDGFKGVNDAYGHDVGDDVLREVAARVSDVLDLPSMEAVLESHADPLAALQDTCGSPLAARLGGDEFALFLPRCDVVVAMEVAEKLLARVGAPYAVSSHAITIGCSIGVAPYPTAGDTYSALLKSADIAMYEAKREGKNRICRYSARLRRQTAANKALGDEMAVAIGCREFVPHFQPQFDARTLKIVAVEALARWQHPARGLLKPDEFMNIARDENLIGAMDSEILARSVEVMRELGATGAAPPKLSVNVSAQRLADPLLLEQVKAMQGLPFGLDFEVVESIYFDRMDDRTAWSLEQLDALGIGFVLDDFGSGQASITALLSLRPGFLKIDGQLTERIVEDRECRDLVRSMADMGRSLGIGVAAECVETEAQLDILRDIGCQRVQGRLLSPPLPAGHFIDLCQGRGRPSARPA